MIEHDAISYGPAIPGKSCEVCVYSKTNVAIGLLCQLHDEKTYPVKRCGMFLSVHNSETSKSEETQGELF